MTQYRLREPISDAVKSELEAYHPLVQNFLFYRGIASQKDAELFFALDNRLVHDFKLFKDIDKAVGRIVGAIKKGEKIVIFSDYDADGIPGAVVLNDFFKEISYTNVEIYIPHRNREGFGLNSYAIDSFADKGVNLIITIDCGSADREHVERAQSLGIDVIITDHHEVDGILPPAYAIINPKQKDCQYPEKMLCGSAVIFKVVQALIAHPDITVRDHFDKSLLDMVGIATLSDMVPLQGENRLFAHYGLKVLQNSPRIGIRLLCAKNNINQRELTTQDVVFSITPRINAASRMDVPHDAFYLLSSRDDEEARTLLTKLEKANNQRRGMVAAMVKDIKERIANRYGEGELPGVIMTGDVSWKPSLLGLVANSIMDTYHRPVFLWGQEDSDHLKGSCRGINDISLHVLMTNASDVFTTYGGHDNAGGFATDHEKIHLLEDRLNEEYRKLKSQSSEKIVWIDGVLNASDITPHTYSHIETLSPFGEGNKEPIFMFTGIVINVKQFGKTNNHCEIVVEKEGVRFKAIAFYSTADSFSYKAEQGAIVSLIGTLEKNTFAGRSELRMRIVDVIQSE